MEVLNLSQVDSAGNADVPAPDAVVDDQQEENVLEKQGTTEEVKSVASIPKDPEENQKELQKIPTLGENEPDVVVAAPPEEEKELEKQGTVGSIKSVASIAKDPEENVEEFKKDATIEEKEPDVLPSDQPEEPQLEKQGTTGTIKSAASISRDRQENVEELQKIPTLGEKEPDEVPADQPEEPQLEKKGTIQSQKSVASVSADPEQLESKGTIRSQKSIGSVSKDLAALENKGTIGSYKSAASIAKDPELENKGTIRTLKSAASISQVPGENEGDESVVDEEAGPQESARSSLLDDDYPEVIPGTDVPFIPLDTVKVRLSRIDQEVSDIHAKYKKLLVSMEENYSRLEKEQDENFQTFLTQYKEHVTAKIGQYQKELKQAKKDRKKLQAYTDNYVVNLQQKVKTVNEEKKKLLEQMESQLGEQEAARFGDKQSRERAYQAELQKQRDEKAALEQQVIEIEANNRETKTQIATQAERAAGLQSRNLSLIVQFRKAKDTRDRAKDAYDMNEPGAKKDEAGELYEEFSTKVERIEKDLADLQERARAEKVSISQYVEPTSTEKFPDIIKRITLATGIGNPQDLEILRQERDRLKEEAEKLKSAMMAPGENDDPAMIAVKAQMAQLRTQIVTAEQNIQELESKLAAYEVHDPNDSINEKRNAERMKTMQAEKAAKEEELALKKAEGDKLMAELEELRRVVGEAAAMEAQFNQTTKMLEDLQIGNAAKEQELKDSLRVRKLLHNQLEDLKGKIRVFCRIRPLSSKEVANGSTSIVNVTDDYTVTCETKQNQLKSFVYDTIFRPDAQQPEVFEDCLALVQSAVDGYNVCIFAYGQTGSGKTHTIQGDAKNPGITPRAMNEIFSVIGNMRSNYEAHVSCYMVELYLDRILDLLLPRNMATNPPPLNIKKDPKGMVTIPEVTTLPAPNSQELEAIFNLGCSNRHVSATSMNDQSSRSHLIISILIDVTNTETNQRTVGKLSLVDLAGSERVKKSGATADKLKEARAINKSLTALGDVISALSVGETHIPYRNNKLTMLMSDSMGGNAKTLMFVNCSPASYNKDETVMSLTYAARVKLITNEPVKNVETREMTKLKQEIMRIQVELGKYQNALKHSGLTPAKVQELLNASHFEDDEGFDDAKYDVVS